MSLAASSPLRILYASGLLAGACTHAATLWTCGLLCDYGGAPLISRIYWTSLTFLDPLAAVLIFLRPRIGLTVALIIMVSDVTNNTLFWITHHSPGMPFDWVNRTAYLLQVAFLVFLSSTVKLAWPVNHG